MTFLSAAGAIQALADGRASAGDEGAPMTHFTYLAKDYPVEWQMILDERDRLNARIRELGRRNSADHDAAEAEPYDCQMPWPHDPVQAARCFRVAVHDPLELA